MAATPGHFLLLPFTSFPFWRTVLVLLFPPSWNTASWSKVKNSRVSGNKQNIQGSSKLTRFRETWKQQDPKSPAHHYISSTKCWGGSLPVTKLPSSLGGAVGTLLLWTPCARAGFLVTGFPLRHTGCCSIHGKLNDSQNRTVSLACRQCLLGGECLPFCLFLNFIQMPSNAI